MERTDLFIFYIPAMIEKVTSLFGSGPRNRQKQLGNKKLRLSEFLSQLYLTQVIH